MKIIVVGDVHLSDVPPVGRVDDYPVSILSKLMEIVDLAKQIEAVVVFVGDIFHRRRFNDYKVISALIKLLREVPCYSIYGNHDWDPRTQDIKGQPIGVLFSSGALQRLSPEGTQFASGLEIKGIDYKRKLDVDQIANLKWTGRWKVLVVHAMIVPQGTSFFGEYWTTDQVKTEADYVLVGHPHWEIGMHRHGHTTFVSNGALARIYSSEAERPVQVTVIEFGVDTHSGKVHKLASVLPPELVFARKVEVVKGVEKPMLVESIVSAMGTVNQIDLANLPIPTELKETVDHYLMLAKQEKM